MDEYGSRGIDVGLLDGVVSKLSRRLYNLEQIMHERINHAWKNTKLGPTSCSAHTDTDVERPTVVVR